MYRRRVALAAVLLVGAVAVPLHYQRHIARARGPAAADVDGVIPVLDARFVDERRLVVAVSRSRVAPVTAAAVAVTKAVTKAVTVTDSLPASLTAALACLRHYESGGDYANRRNPTYRGAYQAGRPTWASYWKAHHRVDLAAIDPAAASPADQDAFAVGLHAERGWEPWPQTSRRCGLR